MMTFWTYAEIAIGIIVSNFPVLPKFFRHFGPRVYKTFSSTSKSLGRGQHVRARPTGSIHPAENIATANQGGSDALGTCDMLYPPSVKTRGDYISLDDFDTKAPGNIGHNRKDAEDLRITATRRVDLEKGRDNFQINGLSSGF